MTASKDGNIGGLLLAAGGSRRMGTPKQLLEFEGRTLLQRAAETLIDSNCDPIVVVLGAEYSQSQVEIGGLPLAICFNGNWQSGMSSSIKAGLNELIRIEPELAAVMITLCDQPHTTADHIDLFATEFRRSAASIVAAEYGGTLGVPALFSRAMFIDLLRLEGDKGARDLIRNSKNTKRIILDEAAFDIDTPEDMEQGL